MAYRHVPVLLKETVRALNLSRDQLIVDGTVGGGGHAADILAATSPKGRLLAFDKDPQAIQYARQRLERFEPRITFINDSFSQLSHHVKRLGIDSVDGVLLDLGFSSAQLEDASRGFSFQLQGPLDLRYDPSAGLSAAELLQTLSESELTRIFQAYGQEPRSRALARAIVRQRRTHPLRTTGDLLALVMQIKGRGRRSLHPATQVWQALRIVVNNELSEIERGIASAIACLSRGSRLAVISFHSGEDRLVKRMFRQAAQRCQCPPDSPVCTCSRKPLARLITKKPIVPSAGESADNPRARSAKLRVLEKM